MTSQVTAAARPSPFFTPRRLRRIREAGLGYLFLLPAFAVLVVFEYWPVFYGAYISTCNWGVKGCIKQIGLANYTKAFSDPEMWHSLLVTATYSILSVPLQLGISLLLAYLLFQKIRGKGHLPGLLFHALHHRHGGLGVSLGVSLQPRQGPDQRSRRQAGAAPTPLADGAARHLRGALAKTCRSPSRWSLRARVLPCWRSSYTQRGCSSGMTR